jgi:hypothetical protein
MPATPHLPLACTDTGASEELRAHYQHRLIKAAINGHSEKTLDNWSRLVTQQREACRQKTTATESEKILVAA